MASSSASARIAHHVSSSMDDCQFQVLCLVHELILLRENLAVGLLAGDVHISRDKFCHLIDFVCTSYYSFVCTFEYDLNIKYVYKYVMSGTIY